MTSPTRTGSAPARPPSGRDPAPGGTAAPPAATSAPGSPPATARRERQSYGLRFRVMASFALGALGMSVVLSLLAYGLTRRSLLHTRQTADIHQTVADAGVVRDGLLVPGASVSDVLDSVTTAPGTQWVAYVQGQPLDEELGGLESLPSALRREVASTHRSASMLTRHGGEALFAVGIAMPAVQTDYYELFNFDDLNRTLAALALSLAAASVATTAAGLAVGRWASRRVLTPLTQTARAATDIAGGRLDTRLRVTGDPDLADLAVSFNAMVAALQRRIERDARFASDVSHELRSPLTTLAAAVEVLEHRRDELTERSARALDLLAAEVQRFERLVEDLLEVSRFDAGAGELWLEDVDPGELVRQAVARFAPGVPVEVDPRMRGATVDLDKRRVERVMANLLENAAVHAGGATRVLLERGQGTIRIVVDDAGSGVPDDQREAVFERFARGSASRNRSRGEGVGLGLSLVAEHVRLHSGRVWVEDSPEGGARFVVELPERPSPPATL